MSPIPFRPDLGEAARGLARLVTGGLALSLFAVALFTYDSGRCDDHAAHIAGLLVALRQPLPALPIALLALAFALPPRWQLDRWLYWSTLSLLLAGVLLSLVLRSPGPRGGTIPAMPFIAYLLGTVGFVSQLRRFPFRTQMVLLAAVGLLLLLICLYPLLHG